MKRIVSGILSLTLLSTCMGISAYADDSKTIDDIDNSITVDTVGSNGYSYVELVDILNEIYSGVLDVDGDEVFEGSVQSVFEDDYYSYVEFIAKTENCKELIESYCEEHGYSEIVVVIVDPTLERPVTLIAYDISININIGDSDSEDSITEFTVGDSVYPRGDINLDGKTNTADLLYLKKYLLGLIEW
ncbi:MAG: hypothetical protein LUG94_01350 [Ruminococcus sp.]|nr:hypothetical protein [Ruminococcus sp.]